LFTFFLLKYIKDPIDVDIMLRRVRAEVAKSTNNYQVPWSSSSLIGEFSFNLSPRVVTAPSPLPVATPSPQPSPQKPVAIVTPPKPTPSLPSNPQRSTLISKTTGVDYTPLRELLQEKKWKEADRKTWDLMLAATKREKEGRIDSESAKKFSCEDFRMIDQEWLAASGGKFGLSVQLKIYKQTGNPIGSYNSEAYARFGDAVGWRVNGIWKSDSDFIWSANAPLVAPLGHLPFIWSAAWVVTGGDRWGWIVGVGGGEVSSRAAVCGL
jgi:hypothetical protein